MPIFGWRQMEQLVKQMQCRMLKNGFDKMEEVVNSQHPSEYLPKMILLEVSEPV